MKAFISRLHFPVTALGPGRRVGLWFQGCSIRCPGCISRDTWEAGTGETGLQAVEAELVRLAPRAEGLTVSGGEPFDQPEALAAVLRKWRSISRRSTLVFTGRAFDQTRSWLATHRDLVDAMVTGPYVASASQTLALRGSDNQELHVLTEAGEEFAPYDRLRDESDRKLDVTFDERGDAWFAGIPGRGDIERLRRTLVGAGHHAETSARAIAR